jgi:N-glycosylase/DNA lyase
MKGMTHIDKGAVNRAILQVCDEIECSSKSNEKWMKYSEAQLWFELVSCILGSRVRYETSHECGRHLETEGLLDIGVILKDKETAKRNISSELNKSMYPPKINGKMSRYPFPDSKATFIVETCDGIYGKGKTTIKSILGNSEDEFKARDLLINICLGIGPKQASLFLRNISYAENLAILDIHIIKYMKFLGLFEGNRDSLTLHRYVVNEKEMLSYANSINKKLSHLDLAIWIVMRVVQKERMIWE